MGWAGSAAIGIIVENEKAAKLCEAWMETASVQSLMVAGHKKAAVWGGTTAAIQRKEPTHITRTVLSSPISSSVS